MIIGVGIDVVDVERFGRALTKTPALFQRLFTSSERSLSLVSLAARFAAKEAFIKAVGSHIHFSWQHIEVQRQPDRSPHFVFEESLAQQLKQHDISQIHLSLTHDGSIASAFVIAERVK